MSLHDHGLPIGADESVEVLCSVSGGKDSTALAIWMREQGIPHRRIFFDTGWEHSSTYEHLDRLAEFIGPIEHIHPKLPTVPDEWLPDVLEIEAVVGRSPSAMVRLIVSRSMFPTPTFRFCTSELKVTPLLSLVDDLIARGVSSVVNAVGVRADESSTRANAAPHEWMRDDKGQDLDVLVWRPLLTWTEVQIRDYLHLHAAPWAPLYHKGMNRLGCWPCVYVQKATLAELARDTERIRAINLLEELVTRIARTRNPEATDRTFFAGRTKEAGPAPIQDLIDWATAERSRGRLTPLQIAMFEKPQPSGCFRWGLCEVKP